MNRSMLTTMRRITICSLGLWTGGCVNISAPDKPIEINLNINVTQEVVYRLDNEAKSLIQQNPGIF
jgi:hypothetical protein